MRFNKKYILFGVIFMILIISIIYRVLNPFVHPTIDKLTYTGNKSINQNKDDKAIKQSREPKTLVSKFLNKPKISGKVYKDLFAIYKPPQKKNVTVSVNKDIQDQKIIDVVKKDPVLEVKEYIASYKLYGTYKSEDKKAVFLAKNKLVLVAKRGDRLDGKYLIDDIQDNYIKIKALDINETIHLDMREFNND